MTDGGENQSSSREEMENVKMIQPSAVVLCRLSQVQLDPCYLIRVWGPRTARGQSFVRSAGAPSAPAPGFYCLLLIRQSMHNFDDCDK